MRELLPLMFYVSLLFSVYTLVQVIKNWKPRKIVKNKKQPTYEWTDVFGIARGYLGLVAIWMLALADLWY